MFKKMILMIILMISFLTLMSSSIIAAADYYVDNNTKHKDIVKWMKNNAKNGDNLIFTGRVYNLNDTIIISKSINIKSENKTRINYKREFDDFEVDMFDVRVSRVNFENLSLNYNEMHGTVILAYGETKTINMKNIDINIKIPPKSDYVTGISVQNWRGNVTNCKININPNTSSYEAISSRNWVGNIVNTEIICKKGTSTISPLYADVWKGNIVNSNISSYSTDTISVGKWSGKIYGSKIITYSKEKESFALSLDEGSKGTIKNCIIKSSGGSAMELTDEVKVSNCLLSSAKKYPNIFRLRPDLVIDSVVKVKNSYVLTYSNNGYIQSKPCTIAITQANKLLKKVSIKGFYFTKTVKIAIPSKYANNQFTKIAIIDYYNKNKEYNKKNNRYKFKF